LNIRSAIERILPAQPCVLCGSMSHDGLWCADCDQALPYLATPHCPVCALPTSGGKTCGQCLQQPPLFTSTTAVFSYAFPLDKLIQAMKYGEQLALASAFAKKLVLRIDKDALPDHVLPMPLHPAKLRERGFNQSLLLAAAVARELHLKLLPGSCQRVRDTPPQSALPWKERDKNVRNAFRCDADLTGKHIALVDDVLTTGASLNALAKAVHQRGAEKISAWVVARTLPHPRTLGRGAPCPYNPLSFCCTNARNSGLSEGVSRARWNASLASASRCNACKEMP
jgi:ComF family protein